MTCFQREIHPVGISRVAQWLACWAHNPKVRGSKPRSAILCIACKGRQHANHTRTTTEASTQIAATAKPTQSKTPTVGLEPTTTRLRALRFTD